MEILESFKKWACIDQQKGWNYPHLLFALILAFSLQQAKCCACCIGSVKASFGLDFY